MAVGLIAHDDIAIPITVYIPRTSYGHSQNLNPVLIAFGHGGC
jgi:hypothetical protein